MNHYVCFFSFLFFVLGLFCFVSFRYHYILLLLSLELLMFSFIPFFFLSFLCFGSSFGLFVFYMVMMVLEGAFGICLVVYYSRFWGGDYFSFIPYFYFLSILVFFLFILM